MARRPDRKRKHFGTGSLALKRETSVFINCPFDKEFEPLFDAIIFSTVCCGFLPRCSFEFSDTSIPRMARITNALLSSKYSIHDLSRCRGEADLNLARFNMPLELGMAMALGSMKLKDPNRHDWLVLVPQGHLYKRFVSDLAGFDPMEHDQRPETLIPAVMSWLATRPEAVYVPTPNAVLSALDTFSKEKAHLSRDWHGQVPWADIVLVAIDIAKALPAK